MMTTSKTPTVCSWLYLALAAVVIAVEYSYMVAPSRPNLTGVLSLTMTLPSVILVVEFAARVFGTRAGDSPAAFLWTMGSAALINAIALFLILRAL